MTITDGSAAETKVGETPNPGMVTLTRSGGDNSKVETVSYSLAGTATNGVDYSSLSGSATFAAGQTSINIPISIIDDNAVEGSEALVISLISSSNYNLGNSVSGTINIADNDELQQWIRQYTTPNFAESVRDLAVDTNGNTYTVGSARNTTTQQVQPLLIKYDSQGNLQWSRQAGDGKVILLFSVTTDNFGNIYATGVGSSSGDQLLKYDSNGNLLWSKSIPRYKAIDTDLWGNIYIGTLNGGVAKYNSSGNLLWQTTSWSTETSSITVDANGNVYAAGYDNQAFLVKYDANGNQLWFRQWTGTSPNDIAADNVGNLYLGGSSSLGGGWISKYDASGNQIWSKNRSNESFYLSNSIKTIEVDSQGGLLINSNGTILGTNSNGDFTLATTITSPSVKIASTQSIASGLNGMVYVAGITEALNSMGEQDIWVARFKP